MKIHSITGDMMEVDGDAAVNAWNTNRWHHRHLMVPAGISGAMKKVTGRQPWRELKAHGPIRIGGAVATGGGSSRWPLVIHVAGIDWRWHTSAHIVGRAAESAIRVASRHDVKVLVMPLIGTGSGGLSRNVSLRAINEVIAGMADCPMTVKLVWPGVGL